MPTACGHHFEAAGPNPYYHWRSINWFRGLIPRSVFPRDLLYSFGAFMTICRVQRNDAEARIRAMAANNWQAESVAASAPRTPARPQGGAGSDEAADAAYVNLEELAADQIERLIEARFKGHELASLVEAILQAEGYTTYRSPAGADGGADILAGGGELGFGKPQICVEVRSGFDPVDRPTVDKLIGAGTGLLPGKALESKGAAREALCHYTQLPEEIRLAQPLKRVWMVAQEGD